MAYTNIEFSHFEVVYCTGKRAYIGFCGKPFADKFDAEGWGFKINKFLVDSGAPSRKEQKKAWNNQSIKKDKAA